MRLRRMRRLEIVEPHGVPSRKKRFRSRLAKVDMAQPKFGWTEVENNVRSMKSSGALLNIQFVPRLICNFATGLNFDTVKLL